MDKFKHTNFVGILTVYSYVALPNAKHKRIAIYKEHFCETQEQGYDVLEGMRLANPHMVMTAELVITRYID